MALTPSIAPRRRLLCELSPPAVQTWSFKIFTISWFPEGFVRYALGQEQWVFEP